MTHFINPLSSSRGILRRAFACCLIGLSALALFSRDAAHAQYADWLANPPKILPNERPGSGTLLGVGSGRQWRNMGAFAALKSDGSVVTWGRVDAGGNSSVFNSDNGIQTSVAGSLSSNVSAVYSNTSAFAARKDDGSVVSWGAASFGGDSAAVAGSLTSDVIAVYSTPGAFAALKSDGSLVTWGSALEGGNSSIYYGLTGRFDNVAGELASNVIAVYSNQYAFAALKSNGSVVAWGNSNSGGALGVFDQNTNNYTSVAGSLTSNVTAIYSAKKAFAALKINGSVITWGDKAWGGDSSSVAGQLASNVTAVYSTMAAFAALKSDGSVVTWGASTGGGNSTAVAASLTSNVTAIYSNSNAFAALKSDGSVVTWGDAGSGGSSSSVAGSLSSNVIAVYSNQSSFAALKSDGSVVTWGDARYGGNASIYSLITDEDPITGDYRTTESYTSVARDLTSNITAVYSTSAAFAALKSDGSVVTWGNSGSGGNSNLVAESLRSNVTAVYEGSAGFAALKRDGSVVSWGTLGGSPAPAGSGFRSIQSVSFYNVGAVVTAANSGITSSTASVSGEVVSEGKSPVTERGFIYAMASVSELKIGDAGVTQVIDGGSGLGSFSTVLSGLTPNTAYILKSYVINKDGPTYSSGVSFSTNLPPVILSNGGNSSVALSLAENSSVVTTIRASDEDADQTIGYSIGGGADAARFAIGAASGLITFVTAPDFEAPSDTNADNIYEVIVKVADNGNPPKSATQTLTITVTNTIDNGGLTLEQPASSPLANGGSVNLGSHTLGQETELTFTLRSNGEADLRLASGILLTGAAAADFSVVSNVPTDLATGSSTTFTVRFTPSSSGARAATLSIPTNDTRPGRSPHVVNLTGTGTAGAIVATYSNAANQVRGGWINETDFTFGAVGIHWPSAESPEKVVDNNSGSKFLAVRNNNVGLIFSPTNAGVVFNRLSFATANDAPERDPASYVIYGSTTVLSGASGSTVPLTGLTRLASGTMVLPDNRSNGPTVVQFANTKAYASYLVAFPTVRSTTNNTLTQISEVQLSQGMNPSFAVAMAGARGGQLSGSTFTFGAIGNSNPGTNWNASESPDQALDGSASSKFLIFRNTGAGLIASPQAGPARVNRLSLWTANDSVERDPLSYQIYGFNDAVSQRSGTLNVATSGSLLASGTLALPATRLTGPVTVLFENSTPYASYLVVFPTVKNSPSTTITQVSEVQFGYNGYPGFDLQLPRKVVAWGNNSVGQSNVPAGLSRTTAISCGWGYSLALKSDRSLVGWGANALGQATAPLSLFTAVAAGPQHALGLQFNDTVAAWGANDRGQATVPAGLIDVAALAAGNHHSVALKGNGTVVTWGDNDWNQQAVPAGLSDVVAISAGAYYTLALKRNGTVVSWGSNPAPVPVGLTGVTAIAAGRSHAMALKSDGTVVVWGGNTAQAVPSGLAGVTAIAAGTDHCLALKNDGHVVAWGDNQSKQSDVPADLAKVISIAGGSNHSLALRIAPVSVAEDSGEFSESLFAINLTPGLGDSGQTVTLACTNDNNALFSAQPAVSPFGTLKFSPAPDASGRTTVTVIAKDSTGLTSASKTFEIEITPVLDPPVLASIPTSTSVTAAAATLGGEVLSSEAPVIERGLVFSPTATNAAPEIGGAGVTKLAASGTLGVFTVEVGNLSASTGYSFRAFATSSLGTSYSQLATFTTVADGLLNPSDGWRFQYFGSAANTGNAADLAAPDGDGIVNLLKYALGITPGQSGAAGLPKAKIAKNSNQSYLSISLSRDPSRNDVIILVEAQGGIGGTWSEIARSVNGAPFSGPAGVTETAAADGTKHVEIRDTQTIGSAARRFMRVRVMR